MMLWLLLWAAITVAVSGQLNLDIGLYDVYGNKKLLADGDVIRYAGSNSAPDAHLYCFSTTSWEHCIWVWGLDNLCTYMDIIGVNDTLNNCPEELEVADNHCHVDTSDVQFGNWFCTLQDIGSGGITTEEAHVDLQPVQTPELSVNNTEVPLTLLVGESVVLECAALTAIPPAHLQWVLDGVPQLESDPTDCNSTEACDTTLVVEYFASNEGQSLLSCVSTQTDSFGVDVTQTWDVRLQVVTELEESLSLEQILFIVFGVLLLLLLLIILILCICCGWCCFAKRSNKKAPKEKLPPTQSMASPPPPPTQVIKPAAPAPPPLQQQQLQERPRVPKRLDIGNERQREPQEALYKNVPPPAVVANDHLRQRKPRMPDPDEDAFYAPPPKIIPVSDFVPSDTFLQRHFSAADELLIYAWEGRGAAAGSTAGSLSSIEDLEDDDRDADWEDTFRAALGDNFDRVWDGAASSDEEVSSAEWDQGPESWM